MLHMPGGRPSTKPRSEFGKRLMKARQKAGLSQNELGERLGLSQRAIAHWERRHVSLYPEQIEVLCEVLKTPAEDLLGFQKKYREKPGPKSKLNVRFEKAEKLPKSQQRTVIQILDMALKSA